MNQLKHRSEFETILEAYEISTAAKELLASLRLVLLSGPSAAGRNTIIEHLVKKGSYKYIVSDTTRKPRINNGIDEKNGINYWFRKEDEFLDDLKHGNFLEAEIIHNQQVSGISIRELKTALSSNQIALTEVEIGGFNNILNLKPDTISIFVLPPDFNVWIDRLVSRSQMSKREIANRVETGKRIFKDAINNNHAHIIVNDDLNKAIKEIDNLAHNKDLAISSGFGLSVAAKLLADTEKYLKGV